MPRFFYRKSVTRIPRSVKRTSPRFIGDTPPAAGQILLPELDALQIVFDTGDVIPLAVGTAGDERRRRGRAIVAIRRGT